MAMTSGLTGTSSPTGAWSCRSHRRFKPRSRPNRCSWAVQVDKERKRIEEKVAAPGGGTYEHCAGPSRPAGEHQDRSAAAPMTTAEGATFGGQGDQKSDGQLASETLTDFSRKARLEALPPERPREHHPRRGLQGWHRAAAASAALLELSRARVFGSSSGRAEIQGHDSHGGRCPHSGAALDALAEVELMILKNLPALYLQKYRDRDND